MAEEKKKIPVSPLNGQPIPVGHVFDSEQAKIAARKSVESRRRKKATKDMIASVFRQTVKVMPETAQALERIGYDPEASGVPSVEMLMILQMATQAMGGDLAAAKFLYDYAQIPDIKVQLERERIELAKQAQATAKDSADKVTVILDV